MLFHRRPLHLLSAAAAPTAAAALLAPASAGAHQAPHAPCPAAPAAASATESATTKTATTKTATTADRRSSRFPTVRSAGVPIGWTPQRTATSTVTVDTPGAVVENLRIVNGDLNIAAPNVTVRRVEIEGGVINNFAGDQCSTGLKLIAVTVKRAPGQVTEGDFAAVGVGGYTARRMEIPGRPRASGSAGRATAAQ